MRGRGLPGCARGVTVPTSMKPKPSAARPSMHAPSLSRPAASPTGFLNVSPITVRGASGTRGASAPARPVRPAAPSDAQSQVVSVFRVHAKELGAYERVEGTEHGTKPGGRKMGTRHFTGFEALMRLTEQGRAGAAERCMVSRC